MRTLFILSFSLFVTSLFSQDQILLKTGAELEVKIIEITQDQIKYKKWSNQEGPLYSLATNEIFKIKYQNGEEEMMNAVTQNNNRPSTANTNSTRSGTRPISSGLNINVLGLLQFGPVISYEAKISENLFIVPHIRLSYLGLLEHVLWSDGFYEDYEMDPASFAIGVGIKKFNLKENNNAFYYGGYVSYSIGSADFDYTYEEQTAVQVTGNFGYRWRKASGWHFNLGLLAGVSIDIEDIEYTYDGRVYHDWTETLPYGMLEFTIGKEF